MISKKSDYKSARKGRLNEEEQIRKLVQKKKQSCQTVRNKINMEIQH